MFYYFFYILVLRRDGFGEDVFYHCFVAETKGGIVLILLHSLFSRRCSKSYEKEEFEDIKEG